VVAKEQHCEVGTVDVDISEVCAVRFVEVEICFEERRMSALNGWEEETVWVEGSFGAQG
jgi:hypothetical protein